jgi:hypothetical protein
LNNVRVLNTSTPGRRRPFSRHIYERQCPPIAFNLDVCGCSPSSCVLVLTRLHNVAWRSGFQHRMGWYTKTTAIRGDHTRPTHINISLYNTHREIILLLSINARPPILQQLTVISACERFRLGVQEMIRLRILIEHLRFFSKKKQENSESLTEKDLQKAVSNICFVGCPMMVQS